MNKVLGLFKSHYSLGRSILTLGEPLDKGTKKPVENSILNILLQNKINTLTLVEDNISGLLEASKRCDDNKIKLIFGIRIDVTDNITQKDAASLTKRAKYIIFAKNPSAYKPLLRIWSTAAKDGFYYNPVIDFQNIKKHWNENFIMAVPFYDSFLYLNNFCSFNHVPEIKEFNPVFFVENNELPFDDILKSKVESFCKENKYNILAAQSIYYNSPNDFIAYLTFRCIHNRASNPKCCLERPDLSHMSSDTFNFEHWKNLNE